VTTEVLVLNSDYEPLNVCNMRRALVMVYLGKADVLHAHDDYVVARPAVSGSPWDPTTHRPIDPATRAPSVVKLRHHVKRPLPELKLTRRTVFARDEFTCQYCGAIGKDMTIDHVVPRRHGGRTEWDNVVCSCRRCNMKKSDKFLHQTGMKLMKQPRRPRYIPYISLVKYLAGRKNDVWRDYLPVFADFPHD
jgi:5-methylcytosine-specific restriction endonuclease McrA